MSPKRTEKPKPSGKEKPQSERFKEIAQRLGADESGQRFERSFREIVPPKRKGASSAKKRKKLSFDDD